MKLKKSLLAVFAVMAAFIFTACDYEPPASVEAFYRAMAKRDADEVLKYTYFSTDMKNDLKHLGMSEKDFLKTILEQYSDDVIASFKKIEVVKEEKGYVTIKNAEGKEKQIRCVKSGGDKEWKVDFEHWLR